MFLRLLILLAMLLIGNPCCEAAWGHKAMVAQSGIRPRQVGTHEGVGMSTRSYEDAIRNACYYGKRTSVSIQTSYRNGRYYAVVRYR